jgi:formyltetrahydrofolate deformylase
MNAVDSKQEFILALSCPSAAGQVAAISGFLDTRGGYIGELATFDDEQRGQFFVRCVFRTDGAKVNLTALRQEFEPIARRFSMDWAMHDAHEKPRVLLLVSKFDHCLNDLLYRLRVGELQMAVPAIVSNHPDLRPIAEAHQIPFHHLPVTAATKSQQEEKLRAIIRDTGTELVVLARYMQILSQELCDSLAGWAINIHHSFLPGFKGAKPYHQAYERGVKLIGATAHFVTSDLDEGPIIEQVVERVDHAHGPEKLLGVGRDSECFALSRAVKYWIERRVFLNGSRTVVFR